MVQKDAAGPEGREHFVRRARGRYCELLSARGERVSMARDVVIFTSRFGATIDFPVYFYRFKCGLHVTYLLGEHVL